VFYLWIHHITHMATGNTCHPTGAQHMYTLEYRYKRPNKRWSSWFAESQHDDRFKAVRELGNHVSKYETFSVRVVRYDNTFDPVETVAEYKFNSQ